MKCPCISSPLFRFAVEGVRSGRFRLPARSGHYGWLLVLFLASVAPAQTGGRFYISASRVTFFSKAPLETITAESTELKGVLDLTTRMVAFSVNNKSFIGFNNPLQKEHFHENYLESEKHPRCTFTGKIIDEFDAGKEGVYPVRVKGMMTVKGVGVERIIKGTLVVKGKEIFLSSVFMVQVIDHEIRIPRIVQQKIAPQIEVTLQATLKREEK